MPIKNTSKITDAEQYVKLNNLLADAWDSCFNLFDLMENFRKDAVKNLTTNPPEWKGQDHLNNIVEFKDGSKLRAVITGKFSTHRPFTRLSKDDILT